MNVEPVVERRWDDRDYDRIAIYQDAKPLPGIFETVEEAEREALARDGFEYAFLESIS